MRYKERTDYEVMIEMIDNLKFNPVKEPEGIVRPAKKPTAIPKPDALKKIGIKINGSFIHFVILLYRRGIIRRSDYIPPFDTDSYEMDYVNKQIALSFELAESYNVITRYDYKGSTYYMMTNRGVGSQFNRLRNVRGVDAEINVSNLWLNAFQSPLPDGCFPESYFCRLIECMDAMNRIEDKLAPFLMAYRNNHFLIGIPVTRDGSVALQVLCRSEEIIGMDIPYDLMFYLTDIKEPDIYLEAFDRKVSNVQICKDGTLAACEDGKWYSITEVYRMKQKVIESQYEKKKLDDTLANSSRDVSMIADANNKIATKIHDAEKLTREVIKRLSSSSGRNSQSIFLNCPDNVNEETLLEIMQMALKYERRMNNGVEGSRRQELLDNISVHTKQEEGQEQSFIKFCNVKEVETKQVGQIPDMPFHNELVVLLEESESIISEQKRMIAEFDSRFEEFFELNDELEARLKKQQEEAARLELIAESAKARKAGFIVSDLSEFYPFEFHDFMIKTVLYYLGNADHQYGHDIIDAVAACNKLQGEKYYNGLEKDLEATAIAFHDSVENGKKRASSAGFIVSSDGKHVKLRFQTYDRYTFVVACTPSDVRASKNFEKILKNKILALRNL